MKFLTDNGWVWRLLRTLAQGFVGVVSVETITYVIAGANLSPATQAILVPIIMSILSPIMERIGVWLNKKE